MVYIIAEAGVDHEGSMSRAFELFKGAREAKADCFKIQYYEKGFKGAHRVLPWLDPEDIRKMYTWCLDYGLDFLITPHDDWAFTFISELDLETIKIGSGDWRLIDAAKATGKSLIISTGGKDFYRITSLYNELIDQRIHFDLLHCVSKYPCGAHEADLWRLDDIKLAGYSDHTYGAHIALAAVAMGATIIEKHMTLERSVPGRNDTTCSLLPNEWEKFVCNIREISQAIES